MKKTITVIAVFAVFSFLLYSGYNEYTNIPSGIDKSFIQNEIDIVDMQIKDLNSDIKDLNSRKDAFNAQISILNAQHLIDELFSKSNALDLKIKAAIVEKSIQKKENFKAGFTVLNKEIAIRREILELYKLELAGDKSMQKGKGRNLRNIHTEIKLRDDKIAALYPANHIIPVKTQTLLIIDEDPAIQILLRDIKAIDDKIIIDRQKLDTLAAQNDPLRVQLKGI